MAGYASQKYEGIFTCDEEEASILRTPTPFITDKDWKLVPSTFEKLLYVRNEILKGGAGLAAPQIGILLPLFIYTPDRTTDGLIKVVNPSLEPVGTAFIDGYEACYSVPLRCTKLKRWKTIKVQYQTSEGQWVEQVIGDFAAKVFQHEMDHLKGKLTIDHEFADVQTFNDAHTFQEHMARIHLEDAKTYNRK